MFDFGNDWDALLIDEFDKEYYQKLRLFLAREYAHKIVHPDMYHIFAALKLTSYAGTKVVILGQDPYHGENQAHGLAFSVQPGTAVPPSLQNIYRELQADLGCRIPNNGFLETWARQGVLLLNTCLTVEANAPNSHRGKGWELFTDRVIALLNDKTAPVVFLLWGNNSKSKSNLITNGRHLLLTAAHPSPLSVSGFYGCRHFSKANAFLQKNSQSVIDWQIPDL